VNQNQSCGKNRFVRLLLVSWLGCLVLVSAAVLAPRSVEALVKFDFEQKYFCHPGYQVWDFCVVRPDSIFHIYYHTLPQTGGIASDADTIWHATSLDLKQWDILGPVLVAGPSWIDAGAVWAPEVVWHDVMNNWAMFYTGVDSLLVQRPCMAFSPDLENWYKHPYNPQFEPDSLTYFWAPTQEWSSFRDPFIYHDGSQWIMLNTAGLRMGGYPGWERGIIHYATSSALVQWEDGGVFYEHDGTSPWHELESSQYHQRGDYHHLFFAEINVPGTSHLVSDSLGGWTMDNWDLLERGGAPEIDEFDPGIDIFSRYAITQNPPTGGYDYVVRFDTLLFNDDGLTPEILKPHPLDTNDWIFRDGTAMMAQPTFGDNPAMRSEESSGMVGNGYLATKEYYQGPLSGKGSPGTQLGDAATGMLSSRSWNLSGDWIRLLVGGGNYPSSCYIALWNANAGTILFRETGNDSETMTWRYWNIRNLRGTKVMLSIVDQETGAFGHINVDEIEEYLNDPLSEVAVTPAVRLLTHRAVPNPCNPATEIHFELGQPSEVEITMHDLRGRVVWRSPTGHYPLGANRLFWPGQDLDGVPVPTGIYLYNVRVDNESVASGKVTIVK